MENTVTFSKTGNYWFFHQIGVGVIYSFLTTTRMLTVTCSSTGQIIEEFFVDEEVFNTEEEFKKAIQDIYINMIAEGITIDLDYMDNPEIIGCIGVDLDILKN